MHSKIHEDSLATSLAILYDVYKTVTVITKYIVIVLYFSICMSAHIIMYVYVHVCMQVCVTNIYIRKCLMQKFSISNLHLVMFLDTYGS